MSPIEALKYNIASRFEFINSYSSQQLKDYVARGKIKPYINWETGNQFIFPKADLVDKSIILTEKFLEYIWMLIYYNWVIFEVDHMTREINETKGKNIEIDRNIIRRAEDLRVHCRSFAFIKNSWSTNLPNPQVLDPIDRFYIERVNGIFLDSVALFLYHEYAHIVLGHSQSSGIEKEISISQEREADNYAFDVFLHERESKLEKFAAGMAVLFTFFSPFFVLVSPGALQQHTHPDIDERLHKALHRVGCEGNEEQYYLFKLAVTLIHDYLLSNRESLIRHGLDIPNKRVQTVQDLFEEYMKVLEQAKIAGL